MSDEPTRAVSFDHVLDTVEAECEWCQRDGRVDRWTAREAARDGEILICHDCGERDHPLPKIDGFVVRYRGFSLATDKLPERFYGERITRELRCEIADVLDEMIPERHGDGDE